MTPDQVEAHVRRIQELYDVPFFEFTKEQQAELVRLENELEAAGYVEADDSTLDRKRYVKRGIIPGILRHLRQAHK